MLPLRDMNPVPNRPLITYALIAINAVVFLHQLALTGAALELWRLQHGVVPYLLTERFHGASLLTPFTSMFMHRDALHLISNMWFLAVFGDNVEHALGRARFAVFYLVCGVAAVAAHVFVDPGSRVAMIGASGAISGVLGAYYRLFPTVRVIALIPALVFIVAWFVLQLLQGLGSLASASQSGIAVFAHIGGFVAGLLLIGSFGPRTQFVHGYGGTGRGRYRFHGEGEHED